MRRNIPESEISPNFTVDDIHKIREWNYERLADIEEGATEVRRAIEEIRRRKVEAERFIALMSRESFDYTEWRRDMFEGMSVREISRLAMQEIEETQ